MELFPDGVHVRLRSRGTGGYLHADDEDGAGVSLRPRARASLNAAWRVQRVALLDSGAYYVLLQGAAYGRYLALSPSPDHRAVQSDYDAPGLGAIMWKAVVAGDGSDDVVVRHFSCRLWKAIPPRPASPVLPGPALNLGGLFCRQRTIRYVWADDHGRFDELGWVTFEFYGRSLFNLRAEVGRHAGEEISSGMTLCVRPGFYGRLTPLVVDLPRSEEPMDIVVLTTWSPANEEMRHPDVDSS